MTGELAVLALVILVVALGIFVAGAIFGAAREHKAWTQKLRQHDD